MSPKARDENITLSALLSAGSIRRIGEMEPVWKVAQPASDLLSIADRDSQNTSEWLNGLYRITYC